MKPVKMKAVELDTQERQTRLGKYYAYQDALKRNEMFRAKYSAAQQTQARNVKDMLDEVYSCKNIYISYRQSFIAVKVDGPRVKNRAALDALEAKFVKAGMGKAVSGQGVIYRIYRNAKR